MSTTTAEKAGIKERILAALTRPMNVGEIEEATGYRYSSVVLAINELFEQKKISATETGWELRAAPNGNGPARRTIAEYEALEASQSPIQPAVAPTNGAPPASSSHMLPRVALSNIQEDEGNIRQEFDPVQLQSLADSIKAHGLLQPLLVRPNPAGANPPFRLIAGARRFRACLLAGVEQVPVLVRQNVTDAEVIEMMLAENDDRADLNPIERANAYKRLAELGVPNKEIARSAGLSPSRVSNALAVLELSEPLQEQVAAGGLSEAHGRALLRHPESIRDALAAHAIAAGLPSKALDVETAKLDWSTVYALRDAGVIRMHPGFEMCSECPHSALIRSSSAIAPSNGWCVNPACYDELDAAVKANIAAANQRVIAEARDHEAVAGHIPEDAELPTIAQLKEQYPEASEVTYGNPHGCSGECECRRQAQQASLNGRVEIRLFCIDPERLQGLRAAQEAARAERILQETGERYEEQEAARAALLADVQARSDDPALLAAVVGRLAWMGEMDLVPEVLRRHAPDTNMDSSDDYGITLDEIAALPPATLIRIAGELALLEPDEAGDSVSQWFQARPAAAADPEQVALSDTLAQVATLRIELRNVKGQLEQAQKLLLHGPPDNPVAHVDLSALRKLQASNQRAREEADAAKTEALQLRTEINRLKADLKRATTPPPPPPLTSLGGLSVGDRVRIVQALNPVLTGTIAPIVHFLDSPIGLLLTLDLGGGETGSFSPSHVELVTAEPPAAASKEILDPGMLALAQEMNDLASGIDPAAGLEEAGEHLVSTVSFSVNGVPYAVDVVQVTGSVESTSDAPFNDDADWYTLTCSKCGATAEFAVECVCDWPEDDVCPTCGKARPAEQPAVADDLDTPGGGPAEPAADRPFAVGDSVTYRLGQYTGQSGVIVAVDIPGVLYQVNLPDVRFPAMAPHRYLEFSFSEEPANA